MSSNPPPPLLQQPFYTALIVGSGFGASVMALRLAEAYAGTGDTVGVLERGRRYEAEDFPRLKLPDYLTDDPELRSSRRVPDGSRHLWPIDQGLFDLRTLGRLQVVQAAGLGGGSLIYAGVHLRPPHEIFASWPAPYNDLSEMDRAFGRVHEVIQPEPLPEQLAAQLPKARLMQEAANRLGLGHATTRPPLTIRFGPRFGAEPNTCNACGNCTLGCQEGAKKTLDRNYLARAIEAGARVQTLSEVTRIARCDGSAQCFYSDRTERCSAPPSADGRGIGEHYRVEYYDHLEHVARHACAQHVFLGAGAVGTTELLMRSRAGLEHSDGPKLDHLGEGFYANGDSLSAVFDTREAAAPSYGPTITTSVAYGDDKGWFLLQEGGIPRDLAAVLGLFRSPIWFGRNRWTRALGRDRGLGEQARSAGDQLVMDLQIGVSDWLNAKKRLAPVRDGQLSALSRAWLQFLPFVLRGPFERGIQLSDTLRGELRKLDRRVLEKLGPETFFLSRLVDQEQLLEQVAGATAELYPPLRRLLRKEAGVAAVFDLLKTLLFAQAPSEHALVLLAMGPDQRGRLSLREGKLRVDWEQDANVELYSRQEQLMRDFAVELGGELRTNPGWTLGRSPVSVHMQGGCSMSVSADGVTDPSGQVRGCPGLYVVDAAAFPGSVGANPSASIAAVAELKAERFLRASLPLPAAKSVPRPLSPVRDYTLHSQPLCVTWQERLSGFWTEHADAQPPREHTDAEGYRFREQAPDPTRRRLTLELKVVIPEAERVLRALTQHLAPREVKGELHGTLFDGDLPAQSCSGELRLHFDPQLDGVAHDLLQLARELGAPPERARQLFAKYAQLPALRSAHRLIALEYWLTTKDGLEIQSRKFFHDDPGHDVWPDLTTLYVHGERRAQSSRRAGIVRVSLSDFLSKQLPSYDCFVHGEPTRDPRGPAADADARYAPDEAVRSWLLLRFGAALFTSIKDVYERWY